MKDRDVIVIGGGPAGLAAAVHAHQRPVGLFAEEAARIEAASVFPRHGFQKGGVILAKAQRLDLHLVQRIGGGRGDA